METVVADALRQSFVIEGGQALSGHVQAAGNKNAALPILAACMLTAEPVELSNVPRILDVDTMLALLRAPKVSRAEARGDPARSAPGLSAGATSRAS